MLRVTSNFGPRLHPIFRTVRKHHGIDYGAPKGTPVRSVASGVVTFCGWRNGYGNYVCIKHSNGYESRYGHLDRYLVKKGDRIKQLEKIGTVGQTGNATGPHLDFQLLVNGTHKNPRRNMEIAQSVHTVVPPLMTRFKAVRENDSRC